MKQKDIIQKYDGEDTAQQSRPIGIGDSVFFGTWKGEPIEWIVLDIWEHERKALVISMYGLENRAFHDTYEPIDWRDCTLRNYLRNSFIQNVFTDAERSRILPVELNGYENSYLRRERFKCWDCIFLLSKSEYKRYGKQIRALCSDLVLEKTSVIEDSESSDNPMCWWLRTSERTFFASQVVENGELIEEGNYVTDDTVVVRPAFYLKINE